MWNKMLQTYHIKLAVWPEKYQLYLSSQLLLDSILGGISHTLKSLVTENPAKLYCMRHSNSHNPTAKTCFWVEYNQVVRMSASTLFKMALMILSCKFKVFWDYSGCLFELCSCLITASKHCRQTIKQFDVSSCEWHHGRNLSHESQGISGTEESNHGQIQAAAHPAHQPPVWIMKIQYMSMGQRDFSCEQFLIIMIRLHNLCSKRTVLCFLLYFFFFSFSFVLKKHYSRAVWLCAFHEFSLIS